MAPSPLVLSPVECVAKADRTLGLRAFKQFAVYPLKALPILHPDVKTRVVSKSGNPAFFPPNFVIAFLIYPTSMLSESPQGVPDESVMTSGICHKPDCWFDALFEDRPYCKASAQTNAKPLSMANCPSSALPWSSPQLAALPPDPWNQKSIGKGPFAEAGATTAMHRSFVPSETERTFPFNPDATLHR